MRVEEREITVPAKTRIQTIYVASDGEEFASEYACWFHERELTKNNSSIYKTAKPAREFYNDNAGTLYYISSLEDYDFFKVMNDIDVSREYWFYSDFKEYGAGWYLYWVEDGGDYPDEQHLKNYDAYEKSIESEWEGYKSRIRSLIEE